MALTLVQSTQKGNSGADTSGTPLTFGVAPTAGNVLIIIAANRGTGGINTPDHGPWTPLIVDGDLEHPTQPTIGMIQAWAKVSDGTETVLAWQNTTPYPGGSPESTVGQEWSGFGPAGSALDDWAGATFVNDGTATFASVTPTSGRDTLLVAAQWKNPANPNPGPQTLSGYTAAGDSAYAMFGNRHRLTAWYKVVTSDGSTYSPGTLSSSGDGSDDGVLLTMALQAGPFAANFSGTPLTGDKALAVQFTDLSSGGSSAASAWEWDFGDGSTSTEQNPYHVYADAGTYTVTLIAHNDSESDSETKVGYITVTTPTASDDVTSPTSGWWVDWGDDGFSAALGGGTGEYELARSMPEAGNLAATGGDEITPWVKKVTWQRGGQGDLLGGQMPGSCVITVNNTDGRFNPDNASGPYYGLLKPGRKVWGGAERTSGTTKGLFGGYLKDIVPIPGPKKEAQLICHDVFGVWKDSRLKVAFSPYRTAKSYRGDILNALGVTATQRSLADEPNQLRVSGANEKNALQVLEQLNAATATRHYCLPADDANDLFLYRTVGRNQNLGNATPALALDENDITAMSGLRLSIDTVVNYQQVSMHPYAFLVFTRVWESGDVPFTMDVSTSKSLDVVFANWVRNAEVKVAYTGAAVTAAITHYGKSATVTLTAAGPTTVTSLYVRGQLASEPSQTVQVAQDLSSQGVYNIVREGNPIDLDLLAIAGDAFAVAEAVVVRSAHPRYRPQVAMRNRFDKYFQADLGDVVEQSVSELSMTRRFEIVGASGAISDGGKVWDFGWTYLETPIQTTLDLFHLNDSLLDGADVLGF